MRKVTFFSTNFSNHVFISFGLRVSCVFNALEDPSLDLHSAFLMVQEMLSHWAQIVSYNIEIGQRQDI